MANPLSPWRNRFADPFRGWENLPSLGRLLDEWPELNKRAGQMAQAFSPTCEVTEDAANYFVKFEVPGVTKDQIKIELHDNVLTLTAEKKEESKKEDKKTHYSEMFYGTYSRSMTLPSAVDEKRVAAKFENGVLSVTLPKSGEVGKKQITIS